MKSEYIIHPRMMRLTIKYALTNLDSRVSLDDLAKFCHTNKFTYVRLFKRESNTTPMKWIWKFRVLVAAYTINSQPETRLKEVYTRCGFTSAAHFSRPFKKVFNIPPQQFQQYATEDRRIYDEKLRWIATIIRQNEEKIEPCIKSNNTSYKNSLQFNSEPISNIRSNNVDIHS